MQIDICSFILLKHLYNRGKRSNLFFFRDSNGNEVDLISEQGRTLAAIEISGYLLLGGGAQSVFYLASFGSYAAQLKFSSSS